jgi:hypothetical protein
MRAASAAVDLNSTVHQSVTCGFGHSADPEAAVTLSRIAAAAQAYEGLELGTSSLL